MKLRTLILFLSLNVVITSLLGQGNTNEYKALKFKHFSLKDGLSQSSVLSILQDKKGFLWFGTRDGLNRYDGYTFKTYRYNSQNKNSLSHSIIKSLFEDELGNLWVGTINGLNRYMPDKDAFERFKQTNNEGSIANNEIWNIEAEDKDHLWLATNLGLKKFNIKSGITTTYKNLKTDTSKLNDNQANSLLKTADGNLWICTTVGVDVYNQKTDSFKHYAYPHDSSKKMNYVPVLYEDNKKQLWLGFKNGLFLFNRENTTFEPYKIGVNNTLAISDEVRSIKEDYLGDLWIGTYNGLYVINSNRNSISHYVHNENSSNSLSHNSIYDIFEDSKGDIWIGTYAGGINYYDRSFDLFKHFSSGTNNSKLNYKVVSSIIEDPSHNLWVATEGGGINFLNKKTGLFSYYTHDDNNPNSLSANNVKSMIRTRDGNFWIGTHEGGLNFLNTKKLPFKFRKYKNKIGDSTSLSNNRVISLLEDCHNNIWIGTSGGGLNVLNVLTNTITRIKDPTDLIGSLIYTITETSDANTLLIGGAKGLVKMDIKTHKINPIHYKEKQSDLYNTSATLCVYEDPRQNLWISTEGDGLYYYNSTSKKSIKYGIPNGLPNEVIYGILPDNYNHIWLSTNYGLSRLNIDSKQFKNFDTSDGLAGNEFNYGAFLKLNNGDLVFGGANGLDFFNPNDIVENAFVPPVFVTSILVNNKPLPNKTKFKNEIHLKYYQNVFSFNFVALSYSQPNKNQFAYKLDGFDDDWNYIGNKKSATYTNLDAGSYVFKVKASNSDGLWNEKGEEIVVNILPAPWKTWWAFLIYGSIFIAILLAIRKYSLLRIYERNELKQERLEKERIEEINQMKLRLFTNISHDFRTPLTLIAGPLERMISKKSGDDFIQKQHENIYRNVNILLQLINQLLDFRKSESGKLQLKASKNKIVSYIENIKLSFDELAKERNINYTFNSSNEDIHVWCDKIKIKKIVLNLLSNAFKFTADYGEISIDVSTIERKSIKEKKENCFFKLVIKDNGIGIPKKNLKFVFDRFYQLGQNENTRSGTGIGLALTKSLVKLHKGTIKVTSIEGKGTSFTVLLPLGKKHLSKKEIINDSRASEVVEQVYLDKGIRSINQLNTGNQNKIKENISIKKPQATILLVEDNIEVRTFIKDIFKDNYNIYEANNGKEGIEIAKKNDIDLIVSDVMMPIMDGIELCSNIKSNILTSHIPVILLTARTAKKSQDSGYKIGADAYITKPFDANILEVRVSNILKSRKSFIKKFKKDIILEPKDVTVTSADELFLQKAIDIVEQNLSNSDFSINMFIAEMSMSRSVLYRKLKALTGQSITEFIRTIKLKKAGQLILKSELNISEIAFELGFNDLKYFRKCFQKLFNVLPSQYREEN